MATIGLKIKITGYADDLIIVWKKSSNPLAEVGRSSPLPFPVILVYTIPDLSPGTYSVEFWRTTDGVTLTEFLDSWEIDASKSAVYGETTFTYVVNRGQTGGVIGDGSYWKDPEEGEGGIASPLIDERLAGATADNCKIESRGFGPYRADEITLLPDGGFYFSDGVTQFSSGDTFFATMLYKSDLPTESAGGGGDYTGVHELKDDVDNTIDFDATFYNKWNYANFSGQVGTIVFPSFAVIPDTKAKFLTHRGNQNYLTLQFSGLETVWFMGQLVNSIDLAKGESLEIFFIGGVPFTAYSGNAGSRGLIVGGYADWESTGRYLKADGTGGELSGNNYPGLYKFILSLPPGSVVPLASYAANPTKWAVNTSTKGFRAPNLSNMFRRFRQTSESTGTYQVDQLGEYTDTVGNSEGGSDPQTVDTYNGGAFKFRNKVRNAGKETTVKNYKEIPLVIL